MQYVVCTCGGPCSTCGGPVRLFVAPRKLKSPTNYSRKNRVLYMDPIVVILNYSKPDKNSIITKPVF